MSVDFQSQLTTLKNNTVTFDFGDRNVISYVVGISYWDLRFSNTDQRVSHISLHLQNSSAGGTVVSTISAILKGGTHNLDPGKSQVRISCIALLDTTNSKMTLAKEVAIPNGGTSSSIALCSSTPGIAAPFLSGFDLEYPGDNKHHVQEVLAISGFKQNGTTGFLTASADMRDRGSPDAENPTIDGSLLYCDSGYKDILPKYLPNQQTTDSVVVNFGEELSKAVVMLSGFDVHYQGNETHDIYGVGGGCQDWKIEGNVVVLNGALAFIYDNSGNHENMDSGISNVGLYVFALKK